MLKLNRRTKPDVQRDLKERLKKTDVAFMHLAKTGGTTIKYTVSKLEKRGVSVPIQSFNHRWRAKDLLDVKPTVQLGIVIREPAERFVSAFYSRLRSGRPDHEHEWSTREAIIFSNFRDPNTLAEWLYSDDEWEKSTARWAANGLRHLLRGYGYYFDSVDTAKSMSDNLKYVWHMKDLSGNLRQMFLDNGIKAEDFDEVYQVAHPAPDRPSPLSDLARQNIRRFWRREVNIYRYLKELADQRSA